MLFAVTIGGLALLALGTAAMAGGLVLLCRRFAPSSFADRHATAVGFAITFFVGYVLQFGYDELQPSRHWHWLPYLGLAAAVIGPVGLAAGVTRLESCLLSLLAATAAAWLLVPTWASLEPPRATYLWVLAGYYFLLTILLTPLAHRASSRVFLGVLLATSVSLAVLIAAAVSITYGALAAVAASAIGGCCVANYFARATTEVAGLTQAFVIVVGGLAFVGFIEPQPPLLGILLLPAVPLALWVSQLGPIGRMQGPKAVLVQSTVTLVPLLILAAWTILQSNRQH